MKYLFYLAASCLLFFSCSTRQQVMSPGGVAGSEQMFTVFSTFDHRAKDRLNDLESHRCFRIK